MSNKELYDIEYKQFCDFLELQCGIVLGENKQYLVKSRLAPLMQRFAINSLSELVQKTLNPIERQLRTAVIDAMTTNETLWFRDTYPFELLKKVILPELEKTKRNIKIWSAASSSGQEPYSISMSVLEYQQLKTAAQQLNVSILGTDISTTMLEQCRRGEYDGLALARGLSPERRSRFFADSGKGLMQLKPEVKNNVSFRHLNLLDSYSLLGKFDVIFCRNVLIYFSGDIKAQIIAKFAQSLNSKGFLILGASESLSSINSDFDMIRCNPGIIYRKKS
ncbi:protein-glutamate O-methyltransferase CheR [Rheinheimera sp. MMS21-TC3]|uniref:CheR family methyltransferase n=1 Tax=Rheinheimera sp. MMS21-TC3 TaxID=3072790 RepID=UPI0028C49960|nr:protein-glutamate O-methyltransferase CheR [Rheinheimera sp. MMS21-TC3]WNO61839.1 protein-glutamate O-methyltransferase CheR [Rheinheimera sp. MMS21-TC3]